MSDRDPDLAEVVLTGIDAHAATVFVSRPGHIESFDTTTQLASVKPELMEAQENEDGTFTAVSLPVISHVPVFSQGGYITTPVKKGDECMLLMADRSMDRWIDRGGDTDPIDIRRHDMQDAVALVGFKSKPNALSEYDNDAVQIGYQNGPRVRVKSDMVHLGVASGADGEQFAAMAQKVMDALDVIKQAFNSHTHLVSTVGGPTAQSGSTTSLISPIGALADVAATKVKVT